MFVHVLSQEGQPLMPMHPAKARKLLKAGRSRPVKSGTGYFTIQLNYPTTLYVQPIIVGIDMGSNRVPIAAITNRRVVYAKEKLLRGDIASRLEERRSSRRQRRAKLRYRKPRFDNRVKQKCARCGINNVPRTWKEAKLKTGTSKKRIRVGRASLCRICQGQKGVHRKEHILPPSVKARADAILVDIDKLSKSLPISKIIVEVAEFDMQKMANPDISGEEYQQGTLQGENLRSYLFLIYKHKCAYCKGLSGDKVLEIEHVYPRSKNGSDKLSNLVVSCRTCNIAKGRLSSEQWMKRLEVSGSEIDQRRLSSLKGIKKRSELIKGFQYSALTQSYKNYLLSELKWRYKTKKLSITYGYITKFNRKRLALEKSQINDAMIIASEGMQFSKPDQFLLERCLKKRRPAEYISPRKEGTPIVKRPWTNEKFGFRLWDKVKTDGHIGYIAALRTSGSFRVHTLDNEEIYGGKSYKKLELVEPCLSNYMREWRLAIQLAVQMEFSFIGGNEDAI
jgi:hypothetical protein